MSEEKKSARTPRERRGLASRLGRIVGGVLSALLLVAILAPGAVYLRLVAGPIDLDPLLPLIEREASARLPGARLSIGSARIEFVTEDERGGAMITISDAVLIDDETGPFALAPELSARFRTSDLIAGRFIPSDVVLTGLSGRLVRAPSGAFRFGFGGLSDDASGDGAAAFERILLAATAAEPSADSDGADDGEGDDLFDAPGRRRLKLRDASILYLDQFADRVYRAEGVEITFWSGRRGLAARARVALDGGRHGQVSGDIRGRRVGADEIDLSVRFENASPGDIAGQIVALDWLAAFDAPVDGEIDLKMDMEGTLRALTGRFEAGVGRIAFDEETSEPISAAALDFTYQPETSRFQIDEASLDAERARFRAAGFVQVNRGDDSAPRDVVAQLDFDDIGVSAPEFFDAPLAYGEGRLTGRVTLDPLLIEIGELRLDRERMRLAAAGRLWPEVGGWRADMTIDGGDFTLDEMMAHWPRQAAPGAREWMLANMEAAEIVDANAVVRLGGGAEEELKIDFTFRDAVGYPLRPMPPIRGGVGSGQVDLKRFSLSLDEGHVRPVGGGVLELAGSTFVIADLDHPATPGTATIRATGAVADALALIDSEPLKLTSALGVPFGEVAGTAEIEAVTTIPLLKDLLLEDVAASATAVFHDVALTAPGLERLASADTLTLDASTTGFLLAGDVIVGTIPAEIVWREEFSPSERSITARADVTPARLAEFGIDQAWFSDGRAQVVATISPTAVSTQFSIETALDGATLSIPEIGWSKPAGAKGSLSAAGVLAGSRLTLDQFALRSADLVAAGAGATDAEGAPERVELTEFRYRGGVDLKLNAEREGRFWRIAVNGPFLDLTSLDDLIDEAISDGLDAPEAEAGPIAPFRVDAKIGELRVTEDRAFNDVEGFLRRTVVNEVVAAADARLAEGAPVSANLMRGPEGGRMRLRIDDAGRFLRDAKAFEDGSGGVLVLRADIAKGDPLRLSGDVRVRNIVIHKDAKLEQMLEGAELSDLREKMRDNGIVFDSILAPFSYENERIALDDAVAKGPSIGVNISGDYVIGEDRLDMSGVFTPLYRINSAVGGIPLIGKLLTGGDGQGLFAFTFSVNGPIATPDVYVNPLSVLAPGILRRIFEGAAEVEADASTSLTPLKDDTER
ncbi:hypothetical protein G5B40_07695 [Pikeienuella piscinae]|uniref:DUF3971 domain-containing protein n=1 Tax=Pikeienuella piscinae TaxID=2748098 RepID=A0A7L5BWZ4_9RHOB|nr:AsmA-like C-terminal region-containing protein [Pikeienuella piscinae]QIE55348.1 hypothetical protein G5B40_07695 [Pikeienuella piscinae]